MKTPETQAALATSDMRQAGTSPATTSHQTQRVATAAVLPELKPFSCSKVVAAHLEKLAIVYVRQSTPQQVLQNRESTARQYALADYARLLGWPEERVLVIDEDLGRSGRSAESRTGFQRLLAEVTMEHAGLVLALEVSRLSRSSRDWNQLFELCGVFGALLADHDGVYDASDPNDRLVLGLKGIMSEMELQTMRNRLDRGRINKAQRGEMFHGVPMGYVILPTGEVDFDPDAQARSVVELLFEKFEELGSIYALFHWLVRHDIQMPIRARSGALKGQIEWRRPSIASLAQTLHHPIYAGAYTYGRRQVDPKKQYAKSGSSYRPWAAMEEWKVLIRNHLPAYITWEQFEKNQEQIRQNRNRPDSSGVPREGCALLAGVLICGTCGRHMQPSYHSNEVAQGRIRETWVSEGELWGDASCLVEEFFGAAGFDPGSQTDHGFGVFAEPVDRVAFDSQIDDSADCAFDRSAANRHVMVTRPAVVHAAVLKAMSDEVVQPCRLVFRTSAFREFSNRVHDRSDFASQKTLLLSGHPAFASGGVELCTVRQLAEIFHRMPEVDQLLNLVVSQPERFDQAGNPVPDPRGSVGHEFDAFGLGDVESLQIRQQQREQLIARTHAAVDDW